MTYRPSLLTSLPLVVVLAAVLVGGVFLLTRADAQARDTIRKHHLQDIEDSLYFARAVHGTYPPYDQVTWCGPLQQGSGAAFAEVEAILREQNDTYMNTEKPFPRDPLLAGAQGQSAVAASPDYPPYFYWKRSPAAFELFAQLEADQNGAFTLDDCDTIVTGSYNYGLDSVERQDRPRPLL